jgi:hypothetical protein
MRGTMVRSMGMTPTISSKQQFHVVGLNTSIWSPNGKHLVIRGNSRIWPKVQLYKEFKVIQWKSSEK